MANSHAALDAAVHRLVFVGSEIEARVALEQAREAAHRALLLVVGYQGKRLPGDFVLDEACHLPGEFHRGEDVIRRAVQQDAGGHAAEYRRGRGLHTDQTAGLFDDARPSGAVGTGSREDNGQGIRAAGGCEGFQKCVDELDAPLFRQRGLLNDEAVFNRVEVARWQGEDFTGFHAGSMTCPLHRKGAFPFENLHQMALTLRGKMARNHESGLEIEWNA